MIKQIVNLHNWKSAIRAFQVICNPIEFTRFLVSPRSLTTIDLRTPTGKHSIACRNRESAKTIFSVFARNDYWLMNDHFDIIDLGSNIGVAAVYFLSRNANNKIFCVEPDPNNLPFLEKNMGQYTDRKFIKKCAISPDKTGKLSFNISSDGKYSSLMPLSEERFTDSIDVEVISINELLSEAFKVLDAQNVILKIDIEGLEAEVAKAIDFEKFPRLKKIIVEAVGVGKTLDKDNSVHLRNGYVEFIDFI